MVRKKRQSKRVSLAKKYKIQKKVSAHKKKVKKEARKNPVKKSKSKDVSIPNLWPFKQELLQQIEEKKVQKEKEAEEARQKRKEDRKALAQLQKDAENSAIDFEKRNEERNAEEAGEPSKPKGDSSRRAYFREFRKVIEAADVILEVLDARDPLGCRCTDIEKNILAKGADKKLILLLNKIDLVPKHVAEKWLKALRSEYPTILFKSSTQAQRKHIGQSSVPSSHASQDLLRSSECLGADTLIQLLKNYCRNMNIKTSITVGVIGLPNVGKSSVINSLKRSKAVGVANTPGFTKTMQEVHLDKHIKLLDCPGIVFTSNESDPSVILRNAVKLEQLEDPISAVQAVMTRCKPEDLMKIFRIPTFTQVTEFLAHVARKRGKLKKGGIPDLMAAARTVLQDWNSGKIRFFTLPPPPAAGVHIEASIVSDWGKAFDLDSLKTSDDSILASLSSAPTNNPDYVLLASGEAPAALKSYSNLDGNEDMEEGEDEDDESGDGDEMADDDEDEEEDEEEEEGEKSKVEAKGKRKNPAPEATVEVVENTKKRKVEAVPQAAKKLQLDPEVNKQSNQDRKKLLKKRKKDIRKGKLIENTTVVTTTNVNEGNDEYDFVEAFGDALDEVADGTTDGESDGEHGPDADDSGDESDD